MPQNAPRPGGLHGHVLSYPQSSPHAHLAGLGPNQATKLSILGGTGPSVLLAAHAALTAVRRRTEVLCLKTHSGQEDCTATCYSMRGARYMPTQPA